MIDAEPEPVARPDEPEHHPEQALPSRATVWAVVLAAVAVAVWFPAADATAWAVSPTPHRFNSDDSVVYMLPLVGGGRSWRCGCSSFGR